MTLRTSLLALAAATGFLASGCVVESRPQATYEWCDFDSDCVAGDICADITVGAARDGMCTHGCIDDRDCPLSNAGYAGACYEVGGASALCYERCDFDSDCTIGFGCYDTTGIPDAICLPR